MTKTSRPMTAGLWIVALLMVAGPVAGCDDDDDDDGGPPTGIEAQADLNGTWRYRAVDLAGPEVVCETSEFDLVLRRSGRTFSADETFTGHTGTFRLDCRHEDEEDDVFTSQRTDVLNGEVVDDRVSFDFADPNFLHVGTVEGSRMSGTVAARLDVSGTAFDEVETAIVVGTWEAVRR